jgi:hypothetical protein
MLFMSGKIGLIPKTTGFDEDFLAHVWGSV